MLQIGAKPQRFRCGNIETKIMSDLKKIKLTDLVRSEKIDTQALAKIKGGYSVMLLDGCYSGICSKKVNPEYCTGGAVCTCGIAG